jgi:glycine dehydrogenase
MVQNNEINEYVKRHIGPNEEELPQMLKIISTASLDTLIEESVPDKIKMDKALNLTEAVGEYEYLDRLKTLAGKNRCCKSFIGL